MVNISQLNGKIVAVGQALNSPGNCIVTWKGSSCFLTHYVEVALKTPRCNIQLQWLHPLSMTHQRPAYLWLPIRGVACPSKRGTINDDMLKLLFRVTQDDIHNVLLLSIVPLLVLLCTVQPSCSTLILAYTTQCAAQHRLSSPHSHNKKHEILAKGKFASYCITWLNYLQATLGTRPCVSAAIGKSISSPHPFLKSGFPGSGVKLGPN